MPQRVYEFQFAPGKKDDPSIRQGIRALAREAVDAIPMSERVVSRKIKALPHVDQLFRFQVVIDTEEE